MSLINCSSALVRTPDDFWGVEPAAAVVAALPGEGRAADEVVRVPRWMYLRIDSTTEPSSAPSSRRSNWKIKRLPLIFGDSKIWNLGILFARLPDVQQEFELHLLSRKRQQSCLTTSWITLLKTLFIDNGIKLIPYHVSAGPPIPIYKSRSILQQHIVVCILSICTKCISLLINYQKINLIDIHASQLAVNK